VIGQLEFSSSRDLPQARSDNARWSNFRIDQVYEFWLKQPKVILFWYQAATGYDSSPIRRMLNCQTLTYIWRVDQLPK